ncbi:hypothetical protein F5B20DRAFT_529169 [Whalleya microplaca]|nr:hypothetical protein F5B20DRAFT_529169 [Whalleya microplaca]
MADCGSFGMFSLTGATVNEVGIDNQGRALRQRRYHGKSRQGCMKCKSRRVKCDEQRPACRKCSTRGLKCDFDLAIRETQVTAYRDRHLEQHLSSRAGTPLNDRIHACISGNPSRTRELSVPTFDLECLQLMYHFEHFASGTLLFGEQLWRDQVLPLALQHEYLMHALLTISASHLHYLQPKNPKHAKAASVHLDPALSGFRSSLNGTNLPHQNVDVIIACGFVLLHYAWSIPFFNVPNDTSPSIESDGLLWFATGVKAVILAVYEKKPREGIFHAYLEANHVQRFYAWSKQENCSYNFEENFLRRSPIAYSNPQDNCIVGCGNISAQERLLPIFRAVDAITRGQDISDIFPSILAYSLGWPSKVMQDFQDEIKAKDPGAMIIMLSFYASNLFILSKRAWWAHHRSKVMCESILAYFTQEESSPWEYNVSKITEYFGFTKDVDGKWELGI